MKIAVAPDPLVEVKMRGSQDRESEGTKNLWKISALDDWDHQAKCALRSFSTNLHLEPDLQVRLEMGVHHQLTCHYCEQFKSPNWKCDEVNHHSCTL